METRTALLTAVVVGLFVAGVGTIMAQTTQTVTILPTKDAFVNTDTQFLPAASHGVGCVPADAVDHSDCTQGAGGLGVSSAGGSDVGNITVVTFNTNSVPNGLTVVSARLVMTGSAAVSIGGGTEGNIEVKLYADDNWSENNLVVNCCDANPDLCGAITPTYVEPSGDALSNVDFTTNADGVTYTLQSLELTGLEDVVTDAYNGDDKITFALTVSNGRVEWVDRHGCIQPGNPDLPPLIKDELDSQGISGFMTKIKLEVVVQSAPEPPTAKCHDLTVQLDSAGNAVIAPADVNAGSTDPEDGVPTLVSVTPNTLDCSNIGTAVTVTLVVEDSAGAQDTCTAEAMAADSLSPTVECVDYTLSLGPGAIGTVQTQDVAGPGTGDNCGFTGGVAPNIFDCTANGSTLSVLYTVTDTSGNSSSCIAQVTVDDPTFECGVPNDPPTAICQDVMVTVGNSASASITPSEVDNGSTDPEDGTNLSLALSSETFSCGDRPQTTVTLTVTDTGGKTDQCTATVTINSDAGDPCPDCIDCVGLLDTVLDQLCDALRLGGAITSSNGILSLAVVAIDNVVGAQDVCGNDAACGAQLLADVGTLIGAP